ncbi:MAG: glycosyltransferase [Vicinamibacterales bacterium]
MSGCMRCVAATRCPNGSSCTSARSSRGRTCRASSKPSVVRGGRACRTNWSAWGPTGGPRAASPRTSARTARPGIRLTGYVPFDDLPAIYSLADIFVFPSLYEGFGLPVVEAMACGVPVITSNSSSLAEIAGDAAMTVDPLSVAALADAILALGLDDGRRRELAARGLVRSRAFSWGRAAREMLGVYRRAAGMAVAPEPRAVDAAAVRSAAVGGESWR